LVRDRNLDATHFLEFVRQDALIQELVPIFDPGDAELAAGHQADDARIGRAGAFGAFDQFARVRCLFAFFDVAQPRHRLLALRLRDHATKRAVAGSIYIAYLNRDSGR
jgi:hypothetical protein